MSRVNDYYLKMFHVMQMVLEEIQFKSPDRLTEGGTQKMMERSLMVSHVIAFIMLVIISITME